ncbi:hypothetical protein [Glycomyces arizonensis]|uniref:hypothetical protein n=1 Tax=Glycomyces arizonensis TaxID=256035 RepID=UPI000417E37D|nr:hypothetical protein [Glycomyces arizonensis]
MPDPNREYERREARPPGRFPRWAKLLLIALAAVAVLAAVLSLVAGAHGGLPRHF